MNNRAMSVKLNKGECIDIRTIADDMGGGLYRVSADNDVGIDELLDGNDLCDAQTESWVWSVGRKNGNASNEPLANGRDVNDREVWISLDARFYQAAGWECLWLR